MRQVHRRVIADSQCIVLLDTSPARNIAQEMREPEWVEIFAQMAMQGYSFSLADGAFAELAHQRSEDRIDTAGFTFMISALEKFLNPLVPICPGKVDVMRMIGASSAPITLYESEVWALAIKSWDLLKNVKPGDTHPARMALSEERGSWKALFAGLEESWKKMGSPSDLDELDHPQLNLALESINQGVNIHPSMAVRNDLQVRLLWRQFVRSKKLKGPYDPESIKKINDGIDFDLYRFLALPALVVANDGGFFKKIENIPSYQRRWFWKPDELAAAWKRGEGPKPLWPAVNAAP